MSKQLDTILPPPAPFEEVVKWSENYQKTESTATFYYIIGGIAGLGLLSASWSMISAANAANAAEAVAVEEEIPPPRRPRPTTKKTQERPTAAVNTTTLAPAPATPEVYENRFILPQPTSPPPPQQQPQQIYHQVYPQTQGPQPQGPQPLAQGYPMQTYASPPGQYGHQGPQGSPGHQVPPSTYQQVPQQQSPMESSILHNASYDNYRAHPRETDTSFANLGNSSSSGNSGKEFIEIDGETFEII